MANWVRFIHEKNCHFGNQNGDVIELYTGDMFSNPLKTSTTINVSEVEFVNPCVPSKMIALWNNYKTLAKEKGLSRPNNPLYLNKAVSAIIEPGQNIERPKFYDEAIFYEGELGIVIGTECKNVEKDSSKNYIFGYTCINDVTAMDLVKKDKSFDQWTRSKSFDTFSIFGPAIVSDIDPMNLQIQSRLNNVLVQDYNSDDMFFNVYEIVSFISKDMTLYPGDIIACGTNAGLGPMNKNDTIEIMIEPIGKITNKLV